MFCVQNYKIISYREKVERGNNSIKDSSLETIHDTKWVSSSLINIQQMNVERMRMKQPHIHNLVSALIFFLNLINIISTSFK